MTAEGTLARKETNKNGSPKDARELTLTQKMV
jgi:hypothetical protein